MSFQDSVAKLGVLWVLEVVEQLPELALVVVGGACAERKMRFQLMKRARVTEARIPLN